MPPLRAVLFDIDDTLVATTEFAALARRNAVHAMCEAGLDHPEDEVYSELLEVIREFSSNYDGHFDRLLIRLPQSATGGVNPALVVAAGVVAYHDTKFRGIDPFEDVVPLMEALHDAGIIIGVITHGLTVKQAEKILRLGLVRLIDPAAIFISDQVGISKPNPKLYATALKRMGLEPSEALYVGDNLEHDVAPAKSLGMHTAWSTRAAKPGQNMSIIADHNVANFRELAEALRTTHGLDLPEF
jgi:putative hydrolase of the HAD superfamily